MPSTYGNQEKNGLYKELCSRREVMHQPTHLIQPIGRPLGRIGVMLR